MMNNSVNFEMDLHGIFLHFKMFASDILLSCVLQLKFFWNEFVPFFKQLQFL